MGKKSNRFPPEVCERAVRMAQQHHGEYASLWAAIESIAPKDSYDNTLTETINGLYKAELIHNRFSWKTKESLKLATLEWAHWFNHHRLLEPIGYIPPAEAETNYYRQLARKTKSPVSL